MSTRPQKTGVGEGGNKKHRQTPYNKNAKGKAGGSGGHAGNANPGGVPGVSKIKSQIRQTTRLLNKVSFRNFRLVQHASDSNSFPFSGKPRTSTQSPDRTKIDVAASGSSEGGAQDGRAKERREISHGALELWNTAISYNELVCYFQVKFFGETSGGLTS